ncbi:MAG TPA: ABC transporter permease [Gemmatimonadales bacterium]|nr:ABC transporter permease [Gemmatimonadales bacterium]
MRPFWKPDLRAEVDAELQFHLEMHIRDLIAAGRTPAAAREEAERRFGEQRAVRDACIAIDTRRRERQHRREVLHDMLQDLRFAFRTLRKSPAFTLVAVLCVGLGVGVTSTILSAVHAILIRPLPYPHPDELLAVYSRITRHGSSEGGINISYPDYVSWRDGNRSFFELGMWTWNALAFSGDQDPERVEAATVTANLFPLLGVRPHFGRLFLPEEEHRGHERVVLLSDGLWRRRFGGDSSIVGRQVSIDGVPYRVIGVMPPGFAFPDRGQAWVPFVVEEGLQEGRGNRGYAGALGRLRPGATLGGAQRDLDLVSRRLQQDFPRDNFGWDAEATSLRQDLVGDMRRPLLVFLGAVGFVLLIVCANVANLTLTRGAARQREIAVRVSLGAGRRRVVRQLLTESLVLAAGGGLLGAALAAYGVKLYALAIPNGLPWYITLRLDGFTLLVSILVSALTGVVFGLLPALRSTDLNLTGTLREGTGGSGEGRRKARLRSVLVVAEVALSVVLLIGAGLLLKSYRALTRTDLGFESHGVLTFRVTLPEAKYDQPAKRITLLSQFFERLRGIPGVQSVGSSNGIPFSGWNVQAEMNVEGHPQHPTGDELVVHYQSLTPGYFESLGIPILRGRDLTAADRDTANRVGVINEILARREFAGQDPLGKRIKIGQLGDPEPWVTIVGVARDFRHYRLPQPMGPAIYFSYFQNPQLLRTVTLRTTLAKPLDLLPAVRGTLRGLDPELPIYQVQTLEQAVERSLWRQRLQSQVIGLFAGLALVLATIGIYGVISYAVAQRTREMGVRMALGASAGRIVGLVVRQGMLLTLGGIGLGLLGAITLTRVLGKLLYEVRATDLATFVFMPIVLGATAVVASWLPARRAAKVDPLVAMRAE